MPYTKQFKKLLDSVKETYLKKKVPQKYKNKYGKVYDKKEIKLVAYAIAKSRGIKIDKKNR